VKRHEFGLAIGCLPRAKTISSPASTRASSYDRVVFAVWIVTIFMGMRLAKVAWLARMRLSSAMLISQSFGTTKLLDPLCEPPSLHAAMRPQRRGDRQGVRRGWFCNRAHIP
jgi:hypothetical protein